MLSNPEIIILLITISYDPSAICIDESEISETETGRLIISPIFPVNIEFVSEYITTL